jgi:hypothetical protein
MNLEKTIQAAFDHYPDLFQERKQVLDHLFCTIGNGFDWIDGELIEDEELVPINPLDENGKAKQYHIITKREARESLYKMIIADKRALEMWNTIILKDGQTLEEKLLSPKEDDNEPEYVSNQSIYPLCKKYSKLFNYPSDIKPDWLEGIKEMFEYIITNVFEDSCRIEIFREVGKRELIDLYNSTFR